MDEVCGYLYDKKKYIWKEKEESFTFKIENQDANQ